MSAPKKLTKRATTKACVRAFSHRPGVYCSTCGKTAKERGV